MFIGDKEIGRILAFLSAGNLVKDAKKERKYTNGEIKQALEAMQDPDSSFHNPEKYMEIIKREEAYEKEREERKLKAAKMMINGSSQKEAQEKMSLDKKEAEEALAFLLDENKDVFSLKRHIQIKKEILQEKQEQEEKQKEKFQKVVRMILEQEYSLKQALNEIDLPTNIFTKLREQLKITNPILEEEMSIVLKENIYKKNKNTEKNKPVKKVETARNMISFLLLEKVPIEKVAYIFKYLPTQCYQYLLNVREENKREQLQPFLEEYYKKYVEGKTDKCLRNKSLQFQKELIMVALTYRVSFSSMALLFNTTIDDILTIYYSFFEYDTPLKNLFQETRNESEKTSKEALKRATQYYKKRNQLAKRTNSVKEMLTKIDKEKELQEENEQKKEALQNKYEQALEEFRMHRSFVFDSLALACKNKKTKEFSEEEQEALAWYRIKYSLSLQEWVTATKVIREVLVTCERRLMEKDAFFKEKIEYLNSKNRVEYLESYARKRKDTASKTIAELIPNQPISLEYFNIKANPLSIE